MENELAPLGAQMTPSADSALGVALASRETGQVMMAMLAAKRFPRDEKAAMDRIINACSRKRLAEQAVYSYAKGNAAVSGPSIRLAEAIAQQWGNVDCGWREVDRSKDADGVGVSSVEAWAWDLETNTRVPRTFTVRHWRDTRSGGYPLKDEREIYELCANQASRRLRACILAVIPGDVVDDAVTQCEVTTKASADNSPEAQKAILEKFQEFNVSKADIEGLIQRRMDAIEPAQVLRLRRIFTSLRDGMSTKADWFKESEKAAPTGDPVDPFEKKAAPEKGNVDLPEASNNKPQDTLL